MNKWNSRKLFVAILGIVCSGIAAQYPSHKETVMWIASIVNVYILGQAHVDAAEAKAGGVL